MLSSKIESLLFITARPLTVKRLMEVCDASKEDVVKALDEIASAHNADGRGIRVLRNGNEVQMSTSPENSKMVQEFLKDETTGDLTKPSLETLTIIAYRGPVSKAELEQIRGVNCSLILRNLLMRGLVEAEGEPYDPATPYRVTMDFLRFLGVAGVEELPEYDKLRSHENVTRVLEMATAKTAPADEAASVAGAETVPTTTDDSTAS
jgi:segregation and condensation protein B